MAHCNTCGQFLSRDDQDKKDGHCQKCRLLLSSGQKNSNKKMEEKKMKKGTKAIIWVASILVFLLLILPLLAGGFRSWIIPLYKWGFDIKAATQTSTAAADTSKTAASNTTEPTAPAATSVPITDDDQFITVYRGATDQETINFDDAWPIYAPTDKIDWTKNSFHMSGGTWTIKENGIISGDVQVNGVAIYDNDETTFLVINVKKGDKVVVNNDWMAWFTNYYDEDLVVEARQTAHPTWTRQWSELN